MSGKCPFSFLSRRSFIRSAGGAVGMLAASSTSLAATKAAKKMGLNNDVGASHHSNHAESLPFWGQYQSGITTPQQKHTYFATLDVVSKSRNDVIQLLKDWTQASSRLTQGKAVTLPKRKVSPVAEVSATPATATVSATGSSASAKTEAYAEAEGDTKYLHGEIEPVDTSYAVQSVEDSGEAEGLKPSRLTLTFGFGPSLFVDEKGVDRFGLAKHRPEALVDMPKFHGDELEPAKTGGDFSIQACSDDPQVAFHAVRTLVRIAEGTAKIRWTQIGFVSGGDDKQTPRNLMGFKDGTQQPADNELDKFVWVNKDGPLWMHGGSYLVARRIRIAIEHWDRTELEFQEQVMGRKKSSGAPLGQKHEKEKINLDAVNKEGEPLIPMNSHVRLASAPANGGAQILRRGYSYNDGVNFTAERWPPWRQGLEYDAGLFFVGYQADPRSGFIKIYQNMAKMDALNQFVTHVGSGLFACPPGVSQGEYLGQKLFESSS